MVSRGHVWTEPTQSRLIVVVGGLLAAVGCAALVWAWAQPLRSLWLPIAMGVWRLVMGAMLAVAIGLGLRELRAVYRRPARFDVANGAFSLRPAFSPAYPVAVQLTVCGFFAAMTISTWLDIADPDPSISLENTLAAWGLTVLMLFLTVFAGAQVVLTWRGQVFELTPAGIEFRSPLLSRTIPWESLAPGGPPRPPVGIWQASKLDLIASRPDLVVQRGWASSSGSRQRPTLPLNVNVHPWFVADAVRWYTEHPEDRAAIGTQTEHDRLVAALAGISWQDGARK